MHPIVIHVHSLEQKDCLLHSVCKSRFMVYFTMALKKILIHHFLKEDIPENAKVQLTLYAPTPQNGQIHSNNSSATADELFECVWPFCGADAQRVKVSQRVKLHFFPSPIQCSLSLPLSSLLPPENISKPLVFWYIPEVQTGGTLVWNGFKFEVS